MEIRDCRGLDRRCGGAGGRLLARHLCIRPCAGQIPMVGQSALPIQTDDYGSFVRDLAAATALAIEGGAPEIVPALMKRTDDVNMSLNATTTQEKAWMLRAAW